MLGDAGLSEVVIKSPFVLMASRFMRPDGTRIKVPTAGASGKRGGHSGKLGETRRGEPIFCFTVPAGTLACHDFRPVN